MDLFSDVNVSIIDYLDSGYRDALLLGRNWFREYMYGSREVSALSLYNGIEYRVLDKILIYRRFIDRDIDFIVITGCYGVVHAFEKIRSYDLAMSRSVYRVWINIGLDKIIANYVSNTSPCEVYGFFTRHSLYREIYRRAMTRQNVSRAYIVYPECIRGGFNTLRVLGETINYLLENNSLPRRIYGCSIVVERIR